MDISTYTTGWGMNAIVAQESGSGGGVLGAPSGNQSGGDAIIGSQDPAGATGAAPSGGLGPFIPLMVLMFAGLLILTSLSGRKERKKHEQLIKGLSKKDKVRAAGGIIGTIIEVKNDEVLLETDRASNTRIRVAKSSVTTVISSKSTPADKAAENADESAELAESK